MELSLTQECPDCHCWSYPNCDMMSEQFGNLARQAVIAKKKADETYLLNRSIQTNLAIVTHAIDYLTEQLREHKDDYLPETILHLKQDVQEKLDKQLEYDKGYRTTTAAIVMYTDLHKKIIKKMDGIKPSDRYIPCWCREIHSEQRKLEDLKRTTYRSTLI